MNFDEQPTPEVKLVAVIEKNENGQVRANPDEIAFAEQWLSDHPVQVETRKGAEQGIAEFENMVADFEATYSLEELNTIVDLSADPERKHPLRDPAKNALKPIFEKLKALKDGSTITGVELDELTTKWKVLSRAVGIVNKGMVDHTR